MQLTKFETQTLCASYLFPLNKMYLFVALTKWFNGEWNGMYFL